VLATIKQRFRDGGSMSEADKEWMEVLKRPSITVSAGSFLLGSWFVFLTIVNIIFGAYSDGRKVNWIDFITNGPVTNSSHEIGLNIPDDIIFGFLSMALVGAGIIGIESSKEGGFSAWLSELPNDRVVKSLISPNLDIIRTVASWMILSGVVFYFSWSIIETTWVDPGVYSVMIALISIGFGLHWVRDSEVN
tara:strand:- start:1122 stop:1697 length:576 start_codon:yes stop_codon:yes gene_type:complete